MPNNGRNQWKVQYSNRKVVVYCTVEIAQRRRFNWFPSVTGFVRESFCSYRVERGAEFVTFTYVCIRFSYKTVVYLLFICTIFYYSPVIQISTILASYFIVTRNYRALLTLEKSTVAFVGYLTVKRIREASLRELLCQWSACFAKCRADQYCPRRLRQPGVHMGGSVIESAAPIKVTDSDSAVQSAWSSNLAAVDSVGVMACGASRTVDSLVETGIRRDAESVGAVDSVRSTECLRTPLCGPQDAYHYVSNVDEVERLQQSKRQPRVPLRYKDD